ncbi:MAG: lamin tail domain-containing protein, partial [Cyclobacteriaceae bacterium]
DVNLSTEIVKLTNIGSQAIDLKGWKLISETGYQVFEFKQSTIIQPGDYLNITSGRNSIENEHNIKWTENYIWNNEGDRALLIKPNNDVFLTN